MFTSIKNGQLAKKSVIIQQQKNLCESFLHILWDEGYISGYKFLNSNQLEIYLKYKKTGEPVINSIKVLSKPGQRVHYSVKQIWKLDSSKSFLVFSTNQGLKSITQCKKLKIGGEPFCLIT